MLEAASDKIIGNLTGAPEGWLWVHDNEYRMGFAPRGGLEDEYEDIRRWGYVFWDGSRLASLGLTRQGKCIYHCEGGRHGEIRKREV